MTESDPKLIAENSVLRYLQSNEEIPDSHNFAKEIKIDHSILESVIKSLSGFQLIDSQDIKKEKWLLTEEAKTYAVNGSPEAQVFSAVPPEGIPRAELEKKVGSQIFRIGSSQAIKNKWLEIGKQLVSRKVDDIQDTLKLLLNNIEDGKAVDDKDIAALKKRKLITLQTLKGYSLKKGPKYAPERKKPATDLTREHLQRKLLRSEAEAFYATSNFRFSISKAAVRYSMEITFFSMSPFDSGFFPSSDFTNLTIYKALRLRFHNLSASLDPNQFRIPVNFRIQSQELHLC